MYNNSIIFGCYAAHLWIKNDTGKMLDFSNIDLFQARINSPPMTYSSYNNATVKLHHVSPMIPILDVVTLLDCPLSNRIESKSNTRSRMVHDLNKYSKLVSYWKDYEPENPDIVHLSFEMDNIRQYLKYL